MSEADPPARPRVTREAAPEFRPDDEVSLRDLYLVLLRGLPFVLLLALVAGGVAYYLNAQRRPVYAAESTVLVTPPPIQIEGDENLSFSPINEVSFQTYETLARSEYVLSDAAARVAGEVDPAALSSLGTLRQLIGPQRVGDVAPLAVIHRVRNGDPERAARLADAWAQSTLAAVRESLFSSLRPVDEGTNREVARLQRNVREVETRVQRFAAEDNGPLLEAELEGLTRQLIDGRERQGDLTREIAAAEARVRALTEQLGASAPVSEGAALEPTLLNVLAAREALANTRTDVRTQPRFVPSAQLGRAFEAALAESDTLSTLLEGNEEEFVGLAQTLYAESLRPLEGALAEEQRAAQQRARAQAEAALELALLGYVGAQTAQTAAQNSAAQDPATPDTGAETGGDALALLSAAELRQEQVALAGLRAERADLEGELSGYTQDAAAIQQQLATLEQRRNRLERELDNVLSSYNDVAGLQSSVSYLTELAPTNARILSQASVPRSPVGPRRGFNTALAAAGGALVGLVLVFLRAAVRRPNVTRKATV